MSFLISANTCSLFRYDEKLIGLVGKPNWGGVCGGHCGDDEPIYILLLFINFDAKNLGLEIR